MNLTAPTNSFTTRSLILADTILVAGFALFLLAFAPQITDVTDLPTNFLRGAGGVLVVWLAYLAITSRQVRISKSAVGTVALVNGMWVFASLGIMAANLVEPNTLGIVFILFQAASVLLLAICQLARWRTMQ